MRTSFISTIFTFIFALTAIIVSADNICLITDEFWNVMIDNELSKNSVEKFKKKMNNIVPLFPGNSLKIEDQRIKKLIIESERFSDMDYIIDEVKQSDGKIFILSPLMSGLLNELSDTFPDRFFISTKETENEILRNVSIFKIDYADAYFKAGEWAAAQDSEVHAIFYVGSERLLLAKQSFVNGWSSIENIEKLNLTTFDAIDYVTSDYIEDFTNSIKSGGNIAAVFTGPHNESFINRFDGTSVSVITEYTRNWSESSYNIGGSIEVPIKNILSYIIKSVAAETYMDGGTVKADFFVSEHQ